MVDPTPHGGPDPSTPVLSVPPGDLVVPVERAARGLATGTVRVADAIGRGRVATVQAVLRGQAGGVRALAATGRLEGWLGVPAVGGAVVLVVLTIGLAWAVLPR